MPDLGPRIQALTLMSAKFKIQEIEDATGLARRTLYDIRARTIERGWNPDVSCEITESYVV